MATKPKKIDADWTVEVRVWVERNGQRVLGKGRAELLTIIDRTQSISAAAREMGMSYRRAWLLVQLSNVAAGVPLVTAAVGGKHGGGAVLTEQGREALAAFAKLQAAIQSVAAAATPAPKKEIRRRRSKA